MTYESAAVRSAATELGIDARAHASRFDADGAVLFFTLTDAESGEPLADDQVADARATVEEAAGEAGAYLLGAPNLVLDPYFETLRETLDPNGILNPSALTSG